MPSQVLHTAAHIFALENKLLSRDKVERMVEAASASSFKGVIQGLSILPAFLNYQLMTMKKCYPVKYKDYMIF